MHHNGEFPHSKLKAVNGICTFAATVKHVMTGYLCNVKNQPPSFGKLTLNPCRTPWYLYKRTLKASSSAQPRPHQLWSSSSSS